MPTPVDVGDAQTALTQARASAEVAAKDIGMGALSPTTPQPAPPLKLGRAPMNKKTAPLGPPTAAQAEVQPQQPTDAESIPHGDMSAPPPPPAPDQAAAKPGAFDQAGSEIGNGIMRFYAGVGRMLSKSGEGLALAAAAESGDTDQDAIKRAADTIQKTADEAVDYWHPQDQSKSGLGAQVLGDVAAVAPALLMGPAGASILPAEAASTAQSEAVNAGQDAKTAAILATIAAGTTALGMKIPLKSPNIWKRIASSVGGNLAINAASQTLTKEILNWNGFKDAAAKIDLTDPRSLLSTIAIGVGFGLHRQAGETPKAAGDKTLNGTRVGQPAAPDAATAAAPPGPPGDEGTPPPPPPSPSGGSSEPTTPPSPSAGASAPVPGNAAAEASAGHPIPDMPSIEPAKDLRAQVRDMNDKNTPRVGVLIAKDSLTSLAGSKDANALSVLGTLNQARTQDRTVQLPQGELMLKTAKIAATVKSRLAAGEDPQKVLGSVTGAGEGKTPDQTVVVQGHDQNGAVATEQAVKPEQQGIAEQRVVDQGKTPVVTTPEAAVQRRIEEISKERNSPTTMGVMTHPDGREIAVHIEEGAPEGMVRVRPLDAEGEPQTKVLDVGQDRVKVGAPKEDKVVATEPQKMKGVEPTTVAKTPEGATTDEPATQAPDTGVGVTPKPESVEAVAKVKAEEAPAPVPVEGQESKPEKRPVEDTSPPKTLKAKKIQTGLEALPAALEAHEKQEQIPTGKKFPASLPERQENASTFAAVLKAAADSARGKVDVSAIERATKAAKAAERLSEKGKEETAQGKGTGHVKITALVNEMHKAARELLGSAREGDETVVKPKEAELLAKRARTAERVKKAAGIETEKPATVRVREKAKPVKTEAAEKPKPVTKTKAEIDREGERLTDRYIHAEEEDLPSARSDVEAYLKEHYADVYTPDQTRELLHLLQERRLDENPHAEQTGPRKMSDTVEEEEAVHDTSPKTLKTLGLRNAGKHALQFATNKLAALKNVVFNNKMQSQYEDLATKMIKGGHLAEVVGKLDTGKASSSHELLNTMLTHASGELHSLLQNLRAHVPDLPVHFVSSLRDLRTGKDYGAHAAGLFDMIHDSIQVVPNRKNAAGTIKTIVHEMVHAATSYELHTNPDGYLAKSLENARQILLSRMARSYSRDTIEQHLAYFRGETKVKPENYNRALYGLTNPEEMLAEIHVNPDFVQEIADSESFKSADENFNDTFLGGAKTLLHKIYNAIGNFLGIKEPQLLQHIAGLAEKTMDIQHMKTAPGRALSYLGEKGSTDFEGELVQAMRNKFGSNVFEISRALPSFVEVSHEPGPLRGVEPEVRASFGDDETAAEPTRTARLFKQAMNSGIIDGVRAIKTALKTVPQIYRDHRRDFGGRNDPANPMNQLQEVDHQKTALIRDMSQHSRDVTRRWMRVTDEQNKTIGTVVRDWTMNRVDPRKNFESQSEETKAAGQGRYDEFARQWDRLQKTDPESARLVSDIFDANKSLARAERRANIDTAVEAFSESPITDAQRSLLYGARTPEAYEELVGPGKLVDVGENNDKFKAALKDFAGQTELNGPYAHLGRHGEYVVSAKPEGTKTFKDEAAARAFAKQVDDLSPNSRGTYAFRGGEHQVDYKIQYTSFHETRNEALQERERLRAAGYDTGLVTRKTMSREDTPLSAGARDLSAAVEAKINRNGKSAGNDALIASLRSAMLHLAASRSAYAGSRLARKNFAGVKPEEMRRSFADHTQSTIWHTAQLRTTFKQAAALSRLRNMARDSEGDADQATLFRRGQAVEALNKHMQDEVQNFGHKSPTNAAIARLGFMSYLASPSHAFIWMTQNFTTGIPVAGARWGYGRASSTFMHAMGSVLSPAMKDAVNESFRKGGSTKDANDAMMRVLSKHDRWGKWAPQIRQMIADGVLGHGYGNELHEMAQAQKSVLGVEAKYVNRAFDVARLLPAMADSFNRVSTALTALELTGGDVRKASDFVDEVHADYSAAAKPLAFKKVGRIPGMNSITMFKTYTQSMIHLFYGNVKAAIDGSSEGGRMEAAKTVAGMVVANALFAGVYGAAAVEPLKLAVYAYHKLFDKEGEVFDLKNSIHNWLVDHLGHAAGGAAAGGLPHIAGFDLSSRMGLTDLFFHDPPDLFTADKEGWKNFAYAQGGPMLDFLASRTSEFVSHMQKGEGFQAVSSLVPVKAYQDAMKAYQLGTTGKMNSIGGQMTKPSAADAAYQAFGLKPSAVADAQEASGTKINYNTQVKATKNAILKAYVSAPPGDAKLKAQARMDSFNQLHPAERIKPTEIRALMNYQQETQSNQPSKDQTLNQMLSYTKK